MWAFRAIVLTLLRQTMPLAHHGHLLAWVEDRQRPLIRSRHIPIRIQGRLGEPASRAEMERIVDQRFCFPNSAVCSPSPGLDRKRTGAKVPETVMKASESPGWSHVLARSQRWNGVTDWKDARRKRE